MGPPLTRHARLHRPQGGLVTAAHAQRERVGLRWLYGLVALPVLTDLVETGRLPAAPREWLTEVVAGLVIAVLVRQVRKEHRAVLALARSDGLTGLWNRRAFEEGIEDECSRARIDRGFRVGGDEFACLLPGSSAAQSEAVVARIREHCARSDAAWVDGPLGLSVGIVEFDAHEAASAFVRRADAPMYRHKASRPP